MKKQIIRYGIVGVLSNFAGYLIYLGVTWLGVDPKIAVTILYPVGALAGYFGHSRYSFSYRGRIAERLPRYILAHVIGYGVNLLLIYVLHDQHGVPHQLTQLIAIFAVAGVLFLLMRYFVFAAARDSLKPAAHP